MRSLPAECLEREACAPAASCAGHEFQQRLVDAAEFLGAEVAVVDRALGLALRLDDATASGRRRGGRRWAGRRPVRTSAGAGVEEAAEAGQAELRAAALAAEGVEDEVEGLPQVGVAGAAATLGEAAQPGGGEVVGVPLARATASAPGSRRASRSSATNRKRSR